MLVEAKLSSEEISTALRYYLRIFSGAEIIQVIKNSTQIRETKDNIKSLPAVNFLMRLI
jgi:hypothetical protein